MSTSLVSVIIPAYNEKESIEELHLRIKRVFADLAQPNELIFIDDGSDDGTIDVLNSIYQNSSNVTVIQHFNNYGKSLALMQGFDAATGDIAISIDADLQNPPEEIPKLLEKILEGYDFVNGSRSDRKDTWTKRFLSKIFNMIVSLIFKIEVQDVNCGLKAYRKNAYKWLDLKGDLHRLVPILITLKGFKTTEVQVQHHERKHGYSKYKLCRHRGLLDIIALAASTTTYIRPFHLFCELAAVLFGLTLLTFLVWYFGRESLPAPTQVLLIGFGIWAIILGTFFPFFGFLLEIEASRFQRMGWRRDMIKKVFSPDV